MSEWSQAVSSFKSSVKEDATLSGARGLQEEEPLLFEQDAPGRTGVDLPPPPNVAAPGQLVTAAIFTASDGFSR